MQRLPWSLTLALATAQSPSVSVTNPLGYTSASTTLEIRAEFFNNADCSGTSSVSSQCASLSLLLLLLLLLLLTLLLLRPADAHREINGGSAGSAHFPA